ncbi:cytosolic carboxypeptidase 6 [Eurytemora carolleeae]|uniref:cytosolic carboxypeptidase 6 n=1 Tax=Eurytemora carolleeae TaxID=1294199 RepID=UPI000C774914|nr:cytosolic carboxypeptidase 6 [Eurytemora carolleeae]|eukprot:XP_023327691.1 cytosolic carboxypeptidase 6-like [Eurytemora affinis]
MWQRMPTTHVFYHRSPLHNKNYVLSWAFSFDLEGEVYQFAMCQPYSYSRHLLYLQNLFSNSYKFIHRDVLGLSVMEREIDLITISHPNNLLHRIQHDGDNPRKVKVVFILGRVHPGETPSSFVIQGFIDFLTSSHEVAICLREHIVFKIVPMLNPVGVFLGNQRCNLLGQDLNRAWADTQRLLHPELDQLKKQLLYYDNHPTYKLDMVLDVHAHTALTGLFIYGNSYEDVYR